MKKVFAGFVIILFAAISSFGFAAVPQDDLRLPRMYRQNAKKLVKKTAKKQPKHNAKKAKKTAKKPIVVDFNAADAFGDTKVFVNRGRTLSEIALDYTGSASNWKNLANHNGIRNERRLPADNPLAVPQSLLKPNLLPSPSAQELDWAIQSNSVMTQNYNNVLVDLLAAQKKVEHLEKEKFFWLVASLVLLVALIFSLIGYLDERSKRFSKY